MTQANATWAYNGGMLQGSGGVSASCIYAIDWHAKRGRFSRKSKSGTQSTMLIDYTASSATELDAESAGIMVKLL